jgi:hypothetical protein
MQTAHSSGALVATHDLNRRLAVWARVPAGEEPFGPVATYRCRPGERPYLHPVHGPGGGPVLTQDRPSDHPWQHGIFTGLHQVNGLDFWQEHRFPDRSGVVRLERLTDVSADHDAVSWRAVARWDTRADEPVLRETQAWTVHRGNPAWYAIDLTWTLRALRDVAFGKFMVGGVAVRLVYNELHETTNANGQRGRAETAEQRAAWCDVSAPFDGSRVWTGDDVMAGAWYGVALFDHPRNPTYPSPWRVDQQGLINPSPSLAGPWALAEGAEASFRHRFVIHAGKADPALLDRLHADFAAG